MQIQWQALKKRCLAAQMAWLLDRGLTLEAQDNQGDTPLHYAVFYTQRAVVLLLLSRGAHVASKNKEVPCPPCIASRMHDCPSSVIGHRSRSVILLVGVRHAIYSHGVS